MATVEIMENSGGQFAGNEIYLSSAWDRSTWICVPTAVNGGGWRRFAYSLGTTLGEVAVVKSGIRPTSAQELADVPENPVVDRRSFTDAVRRGSRMR